MEGTFTGEQLIWGQIGNILIALATASAFLTILAYYFAIRLQPFENSWKRLGKIGFGIHLTSVLGIVGILFYLLLSQRFEYHYVWQHTNKSMEPRYVFASFWEGQEGSFLLWTFWNALIGTFLMFRAKKWESGVMLVFGLVQIWLISMIWGLVIPGFEDTRIGSNPFILTREHPNFLGTPFTQMKDYLLSLDGRGLNPALQNYWMTIHPPTLFLGFALTLVPFAYAMAGLRFKDLTGWIKPALPWAFVCVGILGLGILMGGAWAYEALNFGGFWNWDPVENTSLMPWLVMVAAAHLMLIQQNRKTTVFATLLVTSLVFIFTLFSTFTTRSGILGDASVHAFTDLGMSRQLQLFLFFFMWLPGYFFIREKNFKTSFLILSALLLAAGYLLEFSLGITIAYTLFFIGGVAMTFYLHKKYQPEKKKTEEGLSSREFWMFIGAMVLIISAAHLVMETSKPVLNVLIKTEMAVGKPDDYNQFQIAFAILITSLMGFTQFLRYRETPRSVIWKTLRRSLIVTTGLIVAGVLIFSEFRNPIYIVLAYASLFAVVANLDYIFQFVKTKWRLAGASLAHIGFGLIIFGAVISAGHKKIISQNNNSLNLEVLNPDFINNENIMLHKGDTVQMGDWHLNYERDSTSGINVYFKINYFQEKEGNLAKQFTLYPRVQVNERMGNVAEPSTLHKLHRDIFTHIVYVDKEKLEAHTDHLSGEFKEPTQESIAEGSTIATEFAFVTLNKVQILEASNETDSNFNTRIQAHLEIITFKGDTSYISPILKVEGSSYIPGVETDENTGLKFTFRRIIPPADGLPAKVELDIAEKRLNDKNDYIIMQAIIFPGINILWAGCIIMVIGSLMAVANRWKKKAS